MSKIVARLWQSVCQDQLWKEGRPLTNKDKWFKKLRKRKRSQKLCLKEKMVSNISLNWCPIWHIPGVGLDRYYYHQMNTRSEQISTLPYLLSFWTTLEIFTPNARCLECDNIWKFKLSARPKISLPPPPTFKRNKLNPCWKCSKKFCLNFSFQRNFSFFHLIGTPLSLPCSISQNQSNAWGA